MNGIGTQSRSDFFCAFQSFFINLRLDIPNARAIHHFGVRSMRNRFHILALTTLSMLLAASTQAARADSIDVNAVPSSFSPATIVMHTGQTTTLHFSRTQGVHGIASSELGIPNTILAPGKDVDIAVTPKKAGTYVIHCLLVCGSDHDNMTLTVRVEA